MNSKRLMFRKLDTSDCGATYLAWLRDPEVNRFLETRHVEQTPETIRTFVQKVNASAAEHLYGIFLKEENRHIGNIKVGPIDARHGTADISLFIGDKASWGKGYAAEAIAAISRHAFDNLGVRKLSAGMYEPNQGSLKAFLKCGYREESRRVEHYLLEGRPCDILELGCFKEDLKA